MSHASKPTEIYSALSALGDNVVSVLMPRPDIEVGDEKLRIASKNAAQAVEAASGAHDALVETLTGLDLEEFSSPGLAFFSTGEEVRTVRLNSPPVGMVASGTSPLWLPVVVDAADGDVAWAVSVERDNPRIYRITNDQIEDFSDIINLPDYDTIENRREPQIDALFHSTSSGRVTPNHGGHAKFHALGTSRGQEEEKTDEVFYLELVQALEHGIPETAKTLYLIGDERNVGHVMAHISNNRFNHPEFELHTVHDGALGHDADELHAELKKRMTTDGRLDSCEALEALGPDSLIRLNDLNKAGKEARVETIWVAREAAGFRAYEDDEYLSFDDQNAAAPIKNIQATLQAALETGADFQTVRGSLMPNADAAIGVARY